MGQAVTLTCGPSSQFGVGFEFEAWAEFVTLSNSAELGSQTLA